MRLAFIGFRHSHILALYREAKKHPAVQVVAACEEDPQAAAPILKDAGVELTHSSYKDMLDRVPCDAVAIGDYYGKRGELAIEALRRGKHVIADKPFCTRQSEYEEIASLVARKSLRLGCMLDMRAGSHARTARRLIAEGAIGEVHTVNFTAQHPLMLGSRPAWYFEPGRHGGTINDIGVHAFDAIPWITGRKIVQAVAARAWNARLPQYPHFQDGAQVMLRLDNGGGVLGDLSYLAPDKCGYAAPQYWRQVFHGSEGVLEISAVSKTLSLARRTDPRPQTIELDPARPELILESFLRETKPGGDHVGHPDEIPLTTDDVLAATRVSLQIQQAADREACFVPL